MASLSEVEAIFVTAVIAAAIAAWGVITQRLVTKRLRTIDHLAKQEADKDVIRARKAFNALTDPGGKLTIYNQASDLTPDETNDVRLIMNDYELIAIAIHHQIMDFTIFRQFARGRTLRDWSRAASFVYKLRAEVNNPLIYYEFQNLAQRLEGNRPPKRTSWLRLIF